MTVLITDTQVEAWAHAAKVWAQKLDRIEAELDRSHKHLQWTGARFFDFKARIGGTRNAVARDQQRMAMAEKLLQEVVASVKAERHKLWQDENLVREIVAGQKDPAAFLHKAGYTAKDWPEPYDTEWAHLRQKVVALAESQHHGAGLAI